MKTGLLYRISFVLFAVSFAALVTAMIFHAVQGDSSDAAVIFAIVSAAVAVIGIIFACLSVKAKDGKNETNKN